MPATITTIDEQNVNTYPNSGRPNSSKGNRTRKNRTRKHSRTYSNSKYTQTYSNYGKNIVQIFDDTWLTYIANQLPETYRGLDVGSCDGHFSKQLVAKANEMGKKGEIIAIDPFPTNSDIIAMTGEEYCQKSDSNIFDLVICKYMIHFIKNMPRFLQHITRILRPNGKCYVMSLTSNCRFPWSRKIHKSFRDSCLLLGPFEKTLQEYFPEEWTREIYTSNQTIDTKEGKEQFIHLLRGRGFSNLLQLDNSVIEKSVEEFTQLFDSHPEKCVVHLEVAFYTLCVK